MGKIIEVDEILFGWLIPYVTEIINKFKVGADGRTAYERITGHRDRHVAMCFAKNVEFVESYSPRLPRLLQGQASVWKSHLRRWEQHRSSCQRPLAQILSLTRLLLVAASDSCWCPLNE